MKWKGPQKAKVCGKNSKAEGLTLPDFKSFLQSYSNQISEVLASIQTNRWMKTKKSPETEPKIYINFQLRYNLGTREFSENIVFSTNSSRTIRFHILKNELWSIPCTMYKNELKVDHKSTVKWKYWSLSPVRLFANPWTVARQVSLSMKFFRREYWSSLPFPSPGDTSDPGQTQISCIAGGFFTIWATRDIG